MKPKFEMTFQHFQHVNNKKKRPTRWEIQRSFYKWGVFHPYTWPYKFISGDVAHPQNSFDIFPSY